VTSELPPRKPIRQALGRGLDALLPAVPAKTAAVLERKYGDGALFQCPIERIVARADQPRRRIDRERLDELVASIREQGLIEPIVVRRLAGEEERFEIIAGERRWLASQKAGHKTLPVIVKDVSPEKAFVLALVENLQREELNPVEVAEAFERLLQEQGATQESIAKSVGKSRVAVANALRLLRLPPRVRALVHDGTLTEGHARALLGAPDEPSLLVIADKAVRGRLNVRKVEELVRAARGKSRPVGPAKGATETTATVKSPAIRDLELRLARKLGVRSDVQHVGPGGTITIHYASLDDLDRILELVRA
jgi:ParB family transcriptional regulator, chromosome partitioning protein